MGENNSPVNLDDDTLKAVLLRTNASDHPNLRQLGCQRIQKLIDSEAFVRQRCELGYAEVSSVLVTPWELYQDNYHGRRRPGQLSRNDSYFLENYNDLGEINNDSGGYVYISARILVDGKEAGSVSGVLLPRNNPSGVNFIKMGWRTTEDGCCQMFFNKRGRPRIAEVKEALGEEEDQLDPKPLLFVKKFEMHPLYRSTVSAAKAIRSFVTETALAGRWSVALYAPKAQRSYYSEDDLRQEAKVNSSEYRMGHTICQRHYTPSEEELLVERSWKERQHDLEKEDMRQFLQAGFLQAKEALTVFDSYCVFAVPSFFQTKMMMMLDEQALSSIEILEKPLLPALSQHSSGARKLLEAMIEFCRVQQCMTSTPSQREDAVRSWQAKVRSEVEKLLAAERDNGYEVILESSGGGGKYSGGAIHYCSEAFAPNLVEILMDFVPDDKKADAINSLDRYGRTPLMSAAGSPGAILTPVMMRHFTCERIIGLGADKNIVDAATGRSALGMYRLYQHRIYMDIDEMHNSRDDGSSEERFMVDSLMEELLMPSTGPTAADDSILEEQETSGDEHDEEDDDEDAR